MINWDEFEHIHVIRKLKQILASWWNVDTIFTDERGYLKGFDKVKMTYANPGCAYLMQKDSAVDNLAEVVSKTLEDLRLSENRYSIRKWDLAGFDVGIFPIWIDNDLVGAVVGLGFFKDFTPARATEVRERLAAFGASNEVIELTLAKSRTLDEDARAKFVSLVELTSQEIVTLHVEITQREDRIRELNKELGSRYKYDSMIGKSKPMQALYSLLDKIQTADSTCLIQGDNGTGKELIAKAIHYNSLRKDKAFIIANCGAIPERALWSHEGFFHRRDRNQKRFVRSRRQRNVLLGRNWRDAPANAGASPSRPSGRNLYSCRLDRK